MQTIKLDARRAPNRPKEWKMASGATTMVMRSRLSKADECIKHKANTRELERKCLGFLAFCVRPSANCSHFNSDSKHTFRLENSLPTAKFMRRKTKIDGEKNWLLDNRKQQQRRRREERRGERKIYAGHWPQANNQSSFVQNGLYPFIFYLRLYQSYVYIYTWLLYTSLKYDE